MFTKFQSTKCNVKSRSTSLCSPRNFSTLSHSILPTNQIRSFPISTVFSNSLLNKIPGRYFKNNIIISKLHVALGSRSFAATAGSPKKAPLNFKAKGRTVVAKKEEGEEVDDEE